MMAKLDPSKRPVETYSSVKTFEDEGLDPELAMELSGLDEKVCRYLGAHLLRMAEFLHAAEVDAGVKGYPDATARLWLTAEAAKVAVNGQRYMPIALPAPAPVLDPMTELLPVGTEVTLKEGREWAFVKDGDDGPATVFIIATDPADTDYDLIYAIAPVFVETERDNLSSIGYKLWDWAKAEDIDKVIG
jgi:hypothetical protein